ncbi:hypothetical protein DK842_05885 [Chromobacterium phragmitis]|uniref:beta-ketoacyl synthase N-terminal-like domain-containing protein n=1 Tax=Chromobacterium phragmitis TaxID=2202141 RepID=UPI000DEC1044|nr:beta-ketoacyl synthase N-terminal-like domain-containing protein [Chromobacterium phragmitis]AXE29472.1 hypothetical protein DK842_05885 [Chromobacterium phragmitis]
MDLNVFVEQVRGEALSESAALKRIRELHRAVDSSEEPEAGNAAEVMDALSCMLRETIGCEAGDVDPERSFADYGFNSIALTEFSKRITARYALKPGPAVFLEHPSLVRLSGYLAARLGAVAAKAPLGMTGARPAIAEKKDASLHVAEPARNDSAPRMAFSARPAADGDIAIIGMGGRLPKSDDLHDFWRRIVAGESLISEVPADRWNWRTHFDDPTVANKTDCRHGGFIDDVRGFDAQHFNIAPSEAALIDPQHRLALQAVWETLEAAGYAPASLRQRKVGVFFGVERHDYADLIRARGIDIDGHLNTGNASAMLVNRIAHYFDWRGPVSAVDAACASSFVAIGEAVAALRDGRADAAVAGGVNLLLNPDISIYNRKLGLFTGSGEVRPFDKRADGHVFSDGVGVVLLKRLADAERDQDAILGVIKGISVRHGGRSMFLTAPNAEIHRETISEALREARLSPDDIDYIEAQGTANPIADDVELSAFHEVFGKRRAGKPRLGTVKGQLGHCSGASGVISLIKAILSLRTDTLAKIANLHELNWSGDEGEFACEPVVETTVWKPATRDGQPLPRHIGIHNFGFGGVTGHLVLGEHIGAGASRAQSGAAVFGEQAVLLSARTAPQLEQAAGRLLDFLNGMAGEATLDDIAYTLQTGREHFAHRMVVFADSLPALAEKLSRLLDGSADERTGLRRDGESGGDVRQLFASPEMQSTLRHWLDGRDARSLGRVWASGVAVDWSRLYAGRSLPRKTMLPAYPFARQPLWLPEPSAAAGHGSASLLGRNVSTFASQRYASAFDGGERCFRPATGGGRVFIEPAHLDMVDEALREAAEVAADESVFLRVRGVAHPAPLLADGEPVPVRTTLAPAADGGVSYRLTSGSGEGERVHATGHAELLLLEQAPSLDGDALEGVDGVLERADVLASVGVRDGDVHSEFIAAAALVAAWVSGSAGRAPLPVAFATIGSASVYGRAGADARIWVRPSAQASGGEPRLDIDVFDAGGRVFAQLRDVACARGTERAGAMPEQTNGMIPTLNGTGAMTTRLPACSEAFVEFAATARGEVMDMGCAYGVATIAALERGARVLAVDIDERHLQILSARVPPALKARLETQAGALPGMSVAKGRFAAIHASRVLHFLAPEAFRESLRKMAGWLAPGGKLFLTCDSPYFPHWSARVAEYERLAAQGHEWPGHIADLSAYFRQRVYEGAGAAMDSGERAAHALGGVGLINLVDPDILSRECRLAGLEIEEAGYEGLAIDGVEAAGRGGLEHASVIAVKPTP